MHSLHVVLSMKRKANGLPERGVRREVFHVMANGRMSLGAMSRGLNVQGFALSATCGRLCCKVLLQVRRKIVAFRVSAAQKPW